MQPKLGNPYLMFYLSINHSNICVCVCSIISFHPFNPASRCAGNACSPPVGNLASGRTLHTQSLCCSNSSLMADDPFLHPDTWWESGVTAAGEDEIHLDLEDRFCLTHVVMVFRSPRPAAMTLERSQDFGRTWETLKVFAENCSSAFGLPDDVSQQEALCTSRYSSAMPCTGGEVS